jgi:LAGLIDADG DNA endonuclease family protein
VESAALVKFGYMLEYPCIPRYSFDEATSNSVCESSSENPTDADNQQERLIKIGWITGFVDGEGCFSIHIVRQPQRANRRGYKTGFQVAHQFVVTQGAKSVECLQMMQQYFGVGRLHCNCRYDNHKEHLYQFVVSKRSDLLRTIIPFFQRYPLRTAKHLDFEKFVRCLQIIETNAHLTPRGLLGIVEIMQTMNHRKPRAEMIRILRDYMPNADLFVGEDIVRSAWRHAG